LPPRSAVKVKCRASDVSVFHTRARLLRGYRACLEVKIAHEVRSVTAMKSLVSRGAASSIFPYFAVLDEVRAGTLDARPITMPALRRTLFPVATFGAAG
jgi:DNA-binding transcriptional LysR family regulator